MVCHGNSLDLAAESGMSSTGTCLCPCPIGKGKVRGGRAKTKLGTWKGMGIIHSGTLVWPYSAILFSFQYSGLGCNRVYVHVCVCPHAIGLCESMHADVYTHTCGHMQEYGCVRKWSHVVCVCACSHL